MVFSALTSVLGFVFRPFQETIHGSLPPGLVVAPNPLRQSRTWGPSSNPHLKEVENQIQKYASDPRPPHTRPKYEQISGQNMTPNALKQGKFGSLGAIFLFIFLPCMWWLGLQKESPQMSTRNLCPQNLGRQSSPRREGSKCGKSVEIP